MRSWLQEQVYDVKHDPDDPWRQKIRNTEFGRIRIQITDETKEEAICIQYLL